MFLPHIVQILTQLNTTDHIKLESLVQQTKKHFYLQLKLHKMIAFLKTSVIELTVKYTYYNVV